MPLFWIIPHRLWSEHFHEFLHGYRDIFTNNIYATKDYKTGCTMEEPLSVTFSDIYTAKMENDVVIPSKPIFYCRFIEDIYSRQKLGDNVLFDWLSNYHSSIKLSIEVNPSRFLDTKLTNINNVSKLYVYQKNTTPFTMDLQNSKRL